MAGTAAINSVFTSRIGGSPLDMARRAHALLADRFPPARVRHKPLSILRQEARRGLDQLFDAECPGLPRPDRDRLIEDVLCEAAGFGPLEELFRDEAYSEVMVLAATQVIAKKGNAWLPTSVRFRDAGQLRGYLTKLAETGEQVGAAGATGAFDVRLATGFRVIGVVPPMVLDQPPLAVFVRGEAGGADVTKTTPPGTLTGPPVRSGSIVNTPRSAPPPTDGGSSVTPGGALQRPPQPTPPVAPPPTPPFGTSGVMATPAPRGSGPVPPPTTGADPFARVRQRVTERLIRKCAAAGVYDMSVISTPELQRIILAHVEELSEAERLGLDEMAKQRLTLEILAGMNR